MIFELFRDAHETGRREFNLPLLFPKLGLLLFRIVSGLGPEPLYEDEDFFKCYHSWFKDIGDLGHKAGGPLDN